jgi:hypothetical protein
MIQSQIKLPTSLAGSQSPPWANSANMLIDDGIQASTPTVGHNTNAPYLKLSDFEFSIPLDATVVGVIVRIEGRNQLLYSTGFLAVGASPSTGSGGLQLRGITGGVGRGMTAFTLNTLVTKVVGGDADLWGAASITPEQVNDPAFGLYALFRNGNSTPQKMFIDHIQIEVFFDDNQPEPPIGGNGPVKPT